MTKLSFIYFGVGGVLIKDFSKTNKWESMLTDLGVKSADFPRFDKLYDRHARKINTTLAVDDLLPLIAKELGLTFPPGYSFLQDFINRFEKNDSIWPLVKKAKKKYKIGLLTNMYPKMLDAIKDAKLMPSIKWDAVLDSSVEGVQKPDAVIYQIATNWASVPPREILFVDNNQTNLDSAARAGWQTHYYDSADYEQSTLDLARLLDL